MMIRNCFDYLVYQYELQSPDGDWSSSCGVPDENLVLVLFGLVIEMIDIVLEY